MTQTPSQTISHTIYGADTGNTSNSYEEVAVYSTGGGAGTIYIKNTGSSNSMTIKFTNNFDKIIQFSGSDETALAATEDLIFNINSDKTGISSVKVNIKSTSSGNSTTYSTESVWRRI